MQLESDRQLPVEVTVLSQFPVPIVLPHLTRFTISQTCRSLSADLGRTYGALSRKAPKAI